MLELLYTSTKTVLSASAYFPKAVHLASCDAVVYQLWTNTSDYKKFYKDGTCFEMGQIDLYNPSYLSAESGRGAVLSDPLSNGDDIYHLDEISCLPTLEALNGVDLTGKVSGGSFVDHVAGLVYTPVNSYVLSGGLYYQVIKVYDLDTGALKRTLNVPFSSALDWYRTLARLHYVNSSSLLLSAYNSTGGNVTIFDRVTGEAILRGTVNPANKVVVYDSCHNVIIVLLNTNRVAVYAPNNIGHTLSAPSFSPSPALYTLSQVTTRLTSGDGQGVAGKAILWWLTGDKGDLEYPFTLTDADGYAHNWYYGPPGDYGLGDETVNVEVSC